LKIIIAEKPSLGKNIINAIGKSKFKTQDGYAESSEYVVTWGFGHLLELCDIEEYGAGNQEGGGWTLDGLPFRPQTFRFGLRKKKQKNTKVVDPGIRKQFQVIKKLCARPDAECVISAGDADREGEIIIRIILDHAGNKKPVKRLWLPEQTEESIRAALRILKPDAEYDNLANEGYARTYIDWLYGVNLTRLGTVKAKSLLRVGRVIVPTVKAIYDRDMLIANFVPEPYLALSSKEKTNGQQITLTSKKTFSADQRAQAQATADRYNATPAIVTDVKKEKKEISAGRLFSLSKLQGVLGKKFKISPMESLDLIQKLYEAGYVTYPRTNTEYLAKAEAGRVNDLLAKLQKEGYRVTPKDGKKSIYDDSKIESHSALTPTMKIAKEGDLPAKQWQVYSTIFNRFVAVFCAEPCTVDRTTLIIDVGELERFKLTGDVFLTKGWMEYEESSRSDKVLPALKVGDRVVTNFQLVEKETTPPKHYTVDTFSKFLQNPFRQEKHSLREEEEEAETTTADEAQLTPEEEADYKAMFEGVELGTEATRTSIINNAIESGYISLKNDTYRIEPQGIFYIESLEKLGICLSKEKTAQMGRVLKQVYRGELSVQESVNLAFAEIQELFSGTKGVSLDDAVPGGVDGVVGKCPVCGAAVKENAKAFSCTNRDCSVVFFKDNKLLASIGKRLSATAVKSLLNKGSAPMKNCKSAKTGKTFDCILTVSYDEGGPDFEIEFPDPEANAVGTCPKCGGLITPNKFGNYSCSNWKQGCKYTIYGTVCGKKLTKTQVKALLSKGRTGEIKGFKSKQSGKEFNASLVLEEDGRTSFVFSNSRK